MPVIYITGITLSLRRSKGPPSSALGQKEKATEFTHRDSKWVEVVEAWTGVSLRMQSSSGDRNCTAQSLPPTLL